MHFLYDAGCKDLGGIKCYFRNLLIERQRLDVGPTEHDDQIEVAPKRGSIAAVALRFFKEPLQASIKAIAVVHTD